jgi:hypothetical protein
LAIFNQMNLIEFSLHLYTSVWVYRTIGVVCHIDDDDDDYDDDYGDEGDDHDYDDYDEYNDAAAADDDDDDVSNI